jgi:hypothetical protein
MLLFATLSAIEIKNSLCYFQNSKLELTGVAYFGSRLTWALHQDISGILKCFYRNQSASGAVLSGEGRSHALQMSQHELQKENIRRFKVRDMLYYIQKYY